MSKTAKTPAAPPAPTAEELNSPEVQEAIRARRAKAAAAQAGSAAARAGATVIFAPGTAARQIGAEVQLINTYGERTGGVIRQQLGDTLYVVEVLDGLLVLVQEPEEAWFAAEWKGPPAG